jgi:CheY-like chemotaxis protein
VVNQKVALRILEKLGYRAECVANGAEAVNALAMIPYDLVFLDVQMPVMNGLDATQRIRDPGSGVLNPRIPIVAMTAHTMEGDRENCLQAGMDDFVSKPVSARAIDDVLEKYLKCRTGTRTLSADPGRNESDPVEIPRLKEISGGDPEIERELIQLFLYGMEQHLQALSSAARAEDRVALQREVHSIKGASANLGARKIQEMMDRLEQICTGKDLARVPVLLAALEAEVARARAYLNEYMRAQGSVPPGPPPAG